MGWQRLTYYKEPCGRAYMKDDYEPERTAINALAKFEDMCQWHNKTPDEVNAALVSIAGIPDLRLQQICDAEKQGRIVIISPSEGAGSSWNEELSAAKPLKACPFCGNEAKFRYLNAEDLDSGRRTVKYEVYCIRCGATVRKPDFYTNILFMEDGRIVLQSDARRRIAATWNSRAEKPEKDESEDAE